MDDYILACVWDIDNCITEIDTFFTLHPKKFQEYQNNIMLKKAIQRNLEIIGEAMNRLLKKDEQLQAHFTKVREIVNMRNMVIHSYDALSDDRIWNIVINHLPILKNETTLFLKKHGDL